MALSVMWMSSGQTSVQHFVMLQKPMPPESFKNSGAIQRIERVHFQSGDAHHETRTEECILAIMIAAARGKRPGKGNIRCICETLARDRCLLDRKSSRHQPSE